MAQQSSDKLHCQQARQAWHDQIDGLATPDLVVAMQLHLAHCDQCRIYCDQMKALVGGLDYLRLISENVPAHTKHEKRQVRQLYQRAARIAAAIAIVIGAGLYLSTLQRSSDQTVVDRPVPRAVVQVTQTAKAPPIAAPPARAIVRLTGESAEKYIAVQRDTGNPKVHLFVFYPVIQETSSDENNEEL